MSSKEYRQTQWEKKKRHKQSFEEKKAEKHRFYREQSRWEEEQYSVDFDKECE